MPAKGNKGKQYQTAVCAIMISLKLNDPAIIATGIINKPNEISYEIICAAERKDPKNAYLEFDAHPLRIIPYTPREEPANTNKIEFFGSASTS